MLALAQVTSAPVSLSSEQVALSIFLMGLTALVALISGLSNIYKNFKREPSLADLVTKVRKELADEITDQERDFTERLAAYARIASLDALERRIADELSTIRSERKKSAEEIAHSIRELRHDLTGMVSAINHTLTESFKEIYRALGKTEGKLGGH
jgi:biopolymer transport protein ExbB/TolQ